MRRLHPARRRRPGVRPPGPAALGAALLAVALVAGSGPASGQMDPAAGTPAGAQDTADDRMAGNQDWLGRLLRDMRARQAAGDDPAPGPVPGDEVAGPLPGTPIPLLPTALPAEAAPPDAAFPDAAPPDAAPLGPVPLTGPVAEQEASTPPPGEGPPAGDGWSGGVIFRGGPPPAAGSPTDLRSPADPGSGRATVTGPAPAVPALTGSAVPLAGDQAGSQTAAVPSPEAPAPAEGRQPGTGLLDRPEPLGQIAGDYEVHGELALVSGQLEGFNETCGFGLRPDRDELIEWYRHHQLARNIGRIGGIYELGVELGREGPCTRDQQVALVNYWESLMGRTREFVQAYR